MLHLWARALQLLLLVRLLLPLGPLLRLCQL